MAIPSGIIKYRGTWAVAATYLYADMVVSPIDSKAYVLVVATLTGGADPSVPSANWVLVPNGPIPPNVVDSLNGLTNAVSLTSPDASVSINISGQDIQLQSATATPLPYTLTGTTAGAVITNAPIGNANPFPQNIFTVVTQITLNLPPVLGATDSVYYDGYLFTDWQANFNSFWGVSYATNTFPTFTDILGSTSVTANALQFTNFNQIYLPLNIILPPTHLTSGGTVTLKIFCNPTSANHYLTATPINLARIGIVTN